MAAEKITILAFGSTGDVAPYLALGVGLKSAGYRVHLVSHARFAPMASRYDLSFFGIDDDPASLLMGETGQQWTASGTNIVKAFKCLVAGLGSRLPLYAEHARQQCEGADLIVASTIATLVAFHAAEKLKVGFISALIYPLTPTSELPNALIPTLFRTSPENWASHQIYYRCASLAFRRLTADLRRKMGLNPNNGGEPFSSIHRQQLPVLYGYSEAVVPRPYNWTERTQVTGYWFLPRNSDWKPSDALTDFLASGQPPVCVGFGSMIYDDPEATAKLVLEALEQAGCRGLLLTGWGGLKPKALPDSVFATDSVPHEWIFPRVAAVVHHAGAGTTAASLRAGLPSVTVPFLADQFFWAQRLHRLGVAPQPIPRLKLSSAALGNAISVAIGDAQLRRNASRLAERIGSEDGVACAVEMVSRHLRN